MTDASQTLSEKQFILREEMPEALRALLRANLAGISRANRGNAVFAILGEGRLLGFERFDGCTLFAAYERDDGLADPDHDDLRADADRGDADTTPFARAEIRKGFSGYFEIEADAETYGVVGGDPRVTIWHSAASALAHLFRHETASRTTPMTAETAPAATETTTPATPTATPTETDMNTATQTPANDAKPSRRDAPTITVSAIFSGGTEKHSDKVDGGRYFHARVVGTVPGTKVSTFTVMSFDAEPTDALKAMHAELETSGEKSVTVALTGQWLGNYLKVGKVEAVAHETQDEAPAAAPAAAPAEKPRRADAPVVTVNVRFLSGEERKSEKVEGGRYVYSRMEGVVPGTKVTAFAGMAYDEAAVEQTLRVAAQGAQDVTVTGQWLRNIFKIHTIETAQPVAKAA